MDTFESLVFYRGISAQYPIDRPFLVAPRQDRRPKNSSPHFHEIADQWFERRFGIRYRSNGIFVTSRPLSASAYAASADHVVRIIPTSNYRYCWSPNVSDLLFAASRLAEAPAAEIERWLNDAQYCENGLHEAHTAGHEVMLYCAQYVAIPRNLIDAKTGSAAPSIIVPK